MNQEIELNKVDVFLDLPLGTTYNVIGLHGNPSLLNEKLAPFGIHLEEMFGFVPKKQWNKWNALLEKCDIKCTYWKTEDFADMKVKIEEL